MNLFNKFRNKRPDSSIDALIISDWLQNMLEYYMSAGANFLNNPDAPGLLVSFTLTNSVISTANILHVSPRIAAYTGKLFMEERIYYDCIWQIILLNRFPEATQKIAKLYPHVEAETDIALNNLFQSNKNISGLIGCTTTNEYKNIAQRGIANYIRGESIPDNIKDDDLFVTNSTMLLLRILNIFDDANIKINPEELFTNITNEFVKAIQLKFLTQFDLNKYQCLPDTLFQ